MFRKSLTHQLLLALVLIVTACSPSQKVDTSLPTVTPIPNWYRLSNEGFEIWLPESFIGGTSVDFALVAQRMTEMGPDFEKHANSLKNALETGKTSLIVFASDKNRGNTGLFTNLIVSKEMVPEDVSVEKYVEKVGSRLTEPYKVVKTTVLPSARYPTGVLIANANFPQIGETSQVMYVIKNGDAVWQLVFSTPGNEFQERLPIFEKIVNTINVPYTPVDRTRQGNPTSVGIGVGLITISLLLQAWQKRQKRKKAEVT